MTPHAALGGRREGSCTDDLLCIISGVQWKSGKISAVFLDLSGHANVDGRVGWLWHDVHESWRFSRQVCGARELSGVRIDLLQWKGERALLALLF